MKNKNIGKLSIISIVMLMVVSVVMADAVNALPAITGRATSSHYLDYRKD